jgi:hypothetical protein
MKLPVDNRKSAVLGKVSDLSLPCGRYLAHTLETGEGAQAARRHWRSRYCRYMHVIQWLSPGLSFKLAFHARISNSATLHPSTRRDHSLITSIVSRALHLQPLESRATLRLSLRYQNAQRDRASHPPLAPPVAAPSKGRLHC